MNYKEIKELIEIFDASGVSRLSIKREGFEIELRKQAAPVLVEPAVEERVVEAPKVVEVEASVKEARGGGGEDYIVSPMVGTFYHCPSPGAASYVKVGDSIKKGHTIGIIEAMKIMNEIEAEFDCQIVAIEANDAQPVEFGSRLMRVKKL